MTHFKTRLISRLTNSLILTALLAGCGAPPTVSVKRDWTTTIRNYGLIPVYPMRENVYVGDLRVTGNSDDPFSLGYRAFGHVDLSKIMHAEMAALPELPKTSTAGATASKEIKAFLQTSTYDVTKRRGNSNRMHLAALPSISMARVTAADLAAKGPVGPVSAVFDAGFRAENQVNVVLDGIETLEVSDQGAVNAFRSLCRVNGKVPNINALQASVAQVTENEGSNKDASPHLSMITRVFYARSITYTTLRARSVGAGTNLGKEGTDPTAVEAPTVTTNQDGVLQPVGDVGLTTSLKVNQPGIAASFVHASSTSLSLTQVFERPMAFGVDVLTMQLDELEDGSIVCSKFSNPGNADGLSAVTGTAEEPEQ